MRILYLSAWRPFPTNNGSKLRVAHLLRTLAERHEVSLLTFSFGDAKNDAQEERRSIPVRAELIHANPFLRTGLRHTARHLFVEPSVNTPIRTMTDAVRRAQEQCSFDAVIASTTVMARYALEHAHGSARVLEEHNSMTRWAYEHYQHGRDGPQRLRRWISWQKSRVYEARLFPRFDLVTMVSEQDRAATLQMLPGYHGPVEVAPNGVDCTANQFTREGRKPDTLIYNGALTYSANYDAVRWFIDEIYPRIRTARPNASLTITGATQGVDLSRLKVDPSITLTGYVPDVRVPVSDAMLCVAPIRDGGGTRLKILEAMALGAPVVATSKGAEGLNVVDGEHLLLADSPEKFAASVVTLLANSALRDHLARNARRLVEAQYDWREIGARFTGLVESVVAARKGRLV